MKRIILLLLLMTLQATSYSQPLQFKTSSEIKHYGFDAFRLLSQDSVTLYILAIIDGSYYLDVYSKKTLNRTNQIKIPILSPLSSVYTFDNLIILPDTFLIFYSNYDEGINLVLRMTAFDKRGNLLGDPKIIYVAHEKDRSFRIIDRRICNEFLSSGYYFSDDSIYLNLNHFDYSGNNIKHQNFVLDRNKEIYLSNLIDSSGNLCFVMKNNNASNELSIRIYFSDNTKPQTLMLNKSATAGYLSPALGIFEFNSNKILITPFASSEKSGHCDGIYVSSLNRNYSLNERFISFKSFNKGGETFEFPPANYIVRDVHYFNGGLRIIFEELASEYKKEHGVKLADFTAGDIIAVDIDSSYQIIEMHRIRKRQSCNRDKIMYSSFACLHFNDKSYLIYNELPDNMLKSTKLNLTDFRTINSTEVVYASVEDHIVERKPLIEKPSSVTCDIAILNNYLRDTEKGELYLLRKLEDSFYITKIFVKE